MSEWLVSIIIPVYNVEQYLGRCIDSIANQTYPNLEIILVDDGSTDSSGQKCDWYAAQDERIQVIHKQNAGQGMARNAALDICTGDYILFVDSDDYVELNTVEKLLQFVDQDTDLVLFNGFIDDGITKRTFSLVDRCGYLTKDELFCLYLKEHKVFSGPVMKLIKASAMKDIRFPALKCNEDIYILHEILNNCRKTYLTTDHLYTWYIRADSTEHKAYHHDKLNLLKACDRIEKYTDEQYPQYRNDVLLARLGYIEIILVSMIRSKAIRNNADDYNLLTRDFDRTYDSLTCDNLRYKWIRRHKKQFVLEEKIRFRLARLKRRLHKILAHR